MQETLRRETPSPELFAERCELFQNLFPAFLSFAATHADQPLTAQDLEPVRLFFESFVGTLPTQNQHFLIRHQHDQGEWIITRMNDGQVMETLTFQELN